MRDCLLRVGEASSLKVGDGQIESDASGLLKVWRSNTRNEQKLYLGKETMRLLHEWLAERGEVDADAPLVTRIGKGGRVSEQPLSERSIRQVVKARAAAAKVEGRISGHSLRVGSAQSLVAAGVSIPDIQQAGNWKSAVMVARYGEGLSPKRSAIARYLHGGE